jgi:hypothetical protein
MVNFESDLISTDIPDAFIPTGAIINMFGAYSAYANTSWVDIGLIPCDGRTLSRTTYANLWNTFGTTFTSASTTISSTTVSGLTGMDSATHTGWGIAGTNIPTGATISSVTNSTTVVISAAATATGTVSVAISPYGFTGAGNTTTFNVPLLVPATASLKRFIAGAYPAASNPLGKLVAPASHSHVTFEDSAATPTVNLLSNNDSFTHTHSTAFNTGGASVGHTDGHNWAGGANLTIVGAAPTSGLRLKNDSANNQAASVGHTHNAQNASVSGTGTGISAGATHSHSNPPATTNASTTLEGQHTHNVITLATGATTAVSAGAWVPPYYNVLYFIKA